MISSKAIAFVTAIMAFGGIQCRTQPFPQIVGKVVVADGWNPVLYLVTPRNFSEIGSSFSGTVLDSARIAPDGRFAFEHWKWSEGTGLIQLCIQQNGSRFPNRFSDDNPLISNYMPVVIQQNERLEITGEASRFQASFSIKTPSAENLAMLQLRDIRHQEYGKLSHKSLGSENPPEESELLEHEHALRLFQQPLMDFALNTPYLLPSLVAARWVSTAGDYERIPEFMVSLCDKWYKTNPGDAWTTQLCQSAKREQLPILKGDIIPDKPMPMVNGDTLMLHTLLGGKLTVLDIWASWCMPCRRENREILAPLWAQYHDKGLQIIGYSIDSSPAAWKAAITKDGAAWLHASHLSGDATPFLEALRITTIPASFLLNEKGEIIAKNLHGVDLQLFIADYLK